MSQMTVVTRSTAPTLDLPDVDMSVELAGLRLGNPVLTASGCAASGRELAQLGDLTALGALVTKSVMLAPRAGRGTPRMDETPSGMLNAIGLQGPGIDLFCERDLPWLAERGVCTIVSIAGGTVDEYAELAKRLGDAEGVAGVEVNISCPNVEDRGQVFACHTEPAAAVVTAVRRELPPRVPVLAKLSPDVTDLVGIARACVNAGADALTLVNTLLGMSVDTRTMRPVLSGATGGLSGPAIRPVALRCVWQVHAAMPDVPLVGVGGIRTGEDALGFLAAGASAVQLGTVLFSDPAAPARVRDELHRALAERGITRLRDVVGVAHRAPEDEGPADTTTAGDGTVGEATAGQAPAAEGAAGHEVFDEAEALFDEPGVPDEAVEPGRYDPVDRSGRPGADGSVTRTLVFDDTVEGRS